MATRDSRSFGELLKQYRLAAGLTQEGLAERARLSAQTVSSLERGVTSWPYPETVGLLARALGLAEPERATLDAAARRRGSQLRSPRGGVPEPGAAPAVAPVSEQLPARGAAAAVAALPSGTLTFLLTDVEGSTPLWERHPAAMQRALARHDALVDETLGRHGGRQVKERGEGDSIFAVFASPSAALAAVYALQRALLAEPWPPEAPLRVRMGLHTGEAELRGLGYYGVTVNRTARLRSLAHGGQVLLSQATRDLVRDGLPEGVGLRALGSYSLKGLERPEEVYQLLHPALPADFPPLEGPQALRTNLPAQLTSFIGREREQGEVLALFGGARLVTLTGAGGAGKTRLAQRVAAQTLSDYPDGVWLVELAPLANPALVVQAVAQALGLREEPGRPPLATVTDYLHSRHLLLLLDNCEHLIGACAELATALLQRSPHLRMLATSREGLGMAGETTYRVPSLAVPDLGHLSPPDQLARYEAVALFVERARARRPDFALTAQNAAAVGDVCARLDGLPLAIELAAARMGVLPVEVIAARLDDRFRLLTGGPRTALPRQQTLRATVDWSYELLDEAERVLLRRLSVFAGSCTLAAAEMVCAGGEIREDAVLDLLSGLVYKSLVVLEEREGEGRYRLLETVREYARDRLDASGGAPVRDQHLQWCLALAEAAAPLLRGPEQGLWLGRLDREHDNLRAALTWCSASERQDAENAVIGLRLANALWRFWYVRGHIREGRAWLERMLSRGGDGPLALRGGAFCGAGVLAASQNDYAQAALRFEESLAVWRQLGDMRGIADSLRHLGILASETGNYGAAAPLLDESLTSYRVLGDHRGIANALANLGLVAYARGNYESATALLDESLEMYQALGDTASVAAVLRDLGETAWAQGDVGRGAKLLEESLALRRELAHRRGIANSLRLLGHVAMNQGNHGQAVALFRESLTIEWELGATVGIASNLEGIAALVHSRGEPRKAAKLLGAVEALRDAIDVPVVRRELVQYGPQTAALRGVLGEAGFAAARAAGRGMPLEEAIALALEETSELTG